MSEIIFLEKTSSTNDWLRERCETLPDRTCVVAERQSAGRGRRGHGWETSEGMLAMSVLFRSPPDASTLTARIGLAVCDALSELYPMPEIENNIGIKWPNDILIHDRGAYKKICGILCESVRIGAYIDNDNSDNLNIICGIGVNISQSEEYFQAHGLPNAGSLKMLSGVELPKRTVCEKILEKAIIRVGERFCDCYEEYKARVMNLGREVRILREGHELRARAVDIAQNGSLICENQDGRFEINSGEVSVRGTEGYL